MERASRGVGVGLGDGDGDTERVAMGEGEGGVVGAEVGGSTLFPVWEVLEACRRSSPVLRTSNAVRQTNRKARVPLAFCCAPRCTSRADCHEQHQRG